ncbi:DUF397 domain-containing protein [Streptomyces sp. McG3]|nr:DUF397 domain-containing protein [Streptomyces sp. McG3]
MVCQRLHDEQAPPGLRVFVFGRLHRSRSGRNAVAARVGDLDPQRASNECVEVATAPDAVHVRDSKNVRGPRLAVAPAAWAGFVTYAAAN